MSDQATLQSIVRQLERALRRFDDLEGQLTMLEGTVMRVEACFQISVIGMEWFPPRAKVQNLSLFQRPRLARQRSGLWFGYDITISTRRARPVPR
jgi:hypothetical protein